MVSSSDNQRISPAPVVAVASDLSCFGRCSLAVAFGVLSVMGVQCVPLPTAVLSTHTGGFGAVEKRDLTDFLAPCAAHWERLGLRFAAIYSGYLASEEQAEHIADFTKAHPESALVIDPVMGDAGRMYATLPKSMPGVMLSLSRGAKLITPNLTETCLLTDTPYPQQPLGESSAVRLLESLLRKTRAERALLTGAPYGGGHANLWMTASDGALHAQQFAREPGAYPGTGDLFASVLIGALVRGDGFAGSVSLAAEFVREAVARTNALSTDPRAGVQYEPLLYRLANPASE